MKEKQFITVVGDISPGQKVYSGQIAKVRDYYHYLKIYFGEENVNIIDTSKWRRTLPAVARKLLYSCSHSENIVLMLCGNGRKTILPLVMALKEIYKFNVFFPAIGDVQSVYDDEPFLRSALKKMDGIYFETNRMVDFFKNKGSNFWRLIMQFNRDTIKKLLERDAKKDIEEAVSEDGSYGHCHH